MGYTTIFGDVCENERDEKMMRKYGDKYRCAKRIYPDIYKLPEDEIREMSSIIRYKGDTLEEAEAYLKKYIKENEDEWKKTYLTEDEPKSEENPQSDRQRPNKPGLWDYMVREFKQDGKDVLYGMDRALSGMTLGGYDWLKRKTGLGFDEKAYMAEKEKQGSDMGAKIGGVISEIGGSAIGGGAGIVKGLSNLGLKGVKLAAGAGAAEGLVTGLTSSDTLEELPENVLLNTAVGGVLGGAGDTVMNWGGKLLKPYVKELKEVSPKQFQRYVSNNADKEVINFGTPEWMGRKELIDQLSGKPIQDIQFGKIQYGTLQQVNELRKKLGEPLLSENLIIPQNVVKKWKGNRMTEGYTPEKFAKLVDDVFHENNKIVLPGSYSHIQKIVSPAKKYQNIGFISQNPVTGDTVIKTAYKTNKDVKDFMAGSATPTSLHTLESMPAGTQFSDLHKAFNDLNLTYERAVVNPELQNFTHLYDGLDPYQGVLLTKAINQGGKKSSNQPKFLEKMLEPHKTGSLDSMYKMNQSLEDMMNSGQFNNQALGKVKTKFDDVLNPYKADAAKAYQPFDDTRDISAGISGMWYPLWQQQMQNEE